MPSYLVSMFTAVRAAIATAWPDVVAGGIWHAVEIQRIPWERLAADRLPCAVMDFDLRPAADWGAANAAEDGPVYIYYVAPDSTSLETLVGKLETLRTQLYTTDPSATQVAEYPRISFGADLPINSYFIRTAKPFLAGAVVARLVAGEVP